MSAVTTLPYGFDVKGEARVLLAAIDELLPEFLDLAEGNTCWESRSREALELRAAYERLGEIVHAVTALAMLSE
ncbi:MAG: hypothetical protein QOC86_3108 [Gaiellales bacterium]|jgi:hypothetical protein|nr:hypothetical protein [Gaiellales bacterium]